MDTSTSRPISVAIVGGGIAGLSLAAGLVKQRHLNVHVYEAASAYEDVGAGLALHRNALEAMALIGPEVRQAYINKALSLTSEEEEMIATNVYMAHGPHAGTLVAELGKAKGRKSVSRADLLEGLLALIPKDCISFGKRLCKIRPYSGEARRICLKFSDGSAATVDCVLGADGVHSRVRTYLLGADHPAAAPKNHDRWQIYRTLVSSDFARQRIAEEYTRTVPIMLGPRGHVNCIPLNKGKRLSAGIAIRGVAPVPGDGDDDNQAPPLDPAEYTDYHPAAQNIISMIADDPSASWRALDHDPAPYYTRGRISIFGDAAHTALPFAGNGAGQALEDAAMLNRLFQGVRKLDDINIALATYNCARIERTQKVVELSRKFGRVYAFAEPGIGDDVDKIRAFLDEAGEFMNMYDVKGDIERAFVTLSAIKLERDTKTEGLADANSLKKPDSQD
ncbi:FAD/NAD(P)-binding domain-containing protein [Canariomyces notabilis]|uniref:FAD/NAD(P)-binding domain-containing protein n=1 Tax=Canariomyces notabilis TaxID=2074819 RepID=A0AAN6YTC5_9PEZI|nr:FAD/NAD(P)-binding domain-containing protein [Canariomyces arenarius]